MTRFFVLPEQITDNLASLDADDAHHLRVVLQAKPGEKIAILDGSGREWPGTLETMGKNRATVRLAEPFEPRTEPQTQITVAQALPKMAEKMEQVLQRGTEIGVRAFWAYESARSLSHLTGERQEKRRTRWRAIIKTAAEQAHRARLPNLRLEGRLTDVFAAASDYELALLAQPNDAAPTLRVALAACPRTVLLIIGPESGFTSIEIAGTAGLCVQAVTLGPRILRTETAAMVMAAQILYELEPDVVR